MMFCSPGWHDALVFSDKALCQAMIMTSTWKNCLQKPHKALAIIVEDKRGKCSTEKKVCKHFCLIHFFFPKCGAGTLALVSPTRQCAPSGYCCAHNCRLLYSRTAGHRLSAIAPKIILTTTNPKRFVKNQQRLSFCVFAPQNYVTYRFLSISTFNYFLL